MLIHGSGLLAIGLEGAVTERINSPPSRVADRVSGFTVIVVGTSGTRGSSSPPALLQEKNNARAQRIMAALFIIGFPREGQPPQDYCKNSKFFGIMPYTGSTSMIMWVRREDSN